MHAQSRWDKDSQASSARLSRTALPAQAIGVVRASHSIEIELLQEEDIVQHALLCDSLASLLIMLMPVHTLDHDGLSVDKELPPLYDNVSEAHLQCIIELTFGPMSLPPHNPGRAATSGIGACAAEDHLNRFTVEMLPLGADH